MKIKRIFAGLILVALALGFVAAPPAQAADKVRIIWGQLCVGDTAPTPGHVRFDGKTWTFDEEGWKKSCATIANAGANAVRVLPYGVWYSNPYGRKGQFSPWVLVGDAWDLSKFNDYYFPITRRVVEIANSYGLEAWLPWFDSCQLHTGPWTARSPWKHNINGVASFYDKAADPYCKAWVRKYVAEMAGLRVFWPWGNEIDQPPFPEWAKRVIFPLTTELKIPYDHMTYGATMSEAPYLGNGEFGDKFTVQDTARKLYKAYVGEANAIKVMREVHKCGTIPLDKFCPYGHRPAQAANWWGGRPAVGPWVMSDDGVHEWPNPKDEGRPDAARWKAMATWALGLKNAPHLEHLPGGGGDEITAGVFAAIGTAYKAKFGVWPINYGKWHYDPPVPPVEHVTVTVCKESGLIANPYCPDPVAREFIKGTEPTAVCSIHKKPDDPPVIPPAVKPKCSCWGWLWKGDFKRWIKCLTGGPKHCK